MILWGIMVFCLLVTGINTLGYYGHIPFIYPRLLSSSGNPLLYMIWGIMMKYSIIVIPILLLYSLCYLVYYIRLKDKSKYEKPATLMVVVSIVFMIMCFF